MNERLARLDTWLHAHRRPVIAASTAGLVAVMTATVLILFTARWQVLESDAVWALFVLPSLLMVFVLAAPFLWAGWSEARSLFAGFVIHLAVGLAIGLSGLNPSFGVSMETVPPMALLWPTFSAWTLLTGCPC